MPEITVRFDLPDHWYDGLRRNGAPDVVEWGVGLAERLLRDAGLMGEELETAGPPLAETLVWYAQRLEESDLMSGLLHVPEPAEGVSATLMVRLLPRRFGLLPLGYAAMGRALRSQPDVLDLREVALDTGRAWRARRRQANDVDGGPDDEMDLVQFFVWPNDVKDVLSVVVSWDAATAPHRGDQYEAAADAIVRTLTVELFASDRD